MKVFSKIRSKNEQKNAQNSAPPKATNSSGRTFSMGSHRSNETSSSSIPSPAAQKPVQSSNPSANLQGRAKPNKPSSQKYRNWQEAVQALGVDTNSDFSRACPDCEIFIPPNSNVPVQIIFDSKQVVPRALQNLCEKQIFYMDPNKKIHLNGEPNRDVQITICNVKKGDPLLSPTSSKPPQQREPAVQLGRLRSDPTSGGNSPKMTPVPIPTTPKYDREGHKTSSSEEGSPEKDVQLPMHMGAPKNPQPFNHPKRLYNYDLGNQRRFANWQEAAAASNDKRVQFVGPDRDCEITMENGTLYIPADPSLPVEFPVVSEEWTNVMEILVQLQICKVNAKYILEMNGDPSRKINLTFRDLVSKSPAAQGAPKQASQVPTYVGANGQGEFTPYGRVAPAFAPGAGSFVQFPANGAPMYIGSTASEESVPTGAVHQPAFIPGEGSFTQIPSSSSVQYVTATSIPEEEELDESAPPPKVAPPPLRSDNKSLTVGMSPNRIRDLETHVKWLLKEAREYIDAPAKFNVSPDDPRLKRSRRIIEGAMRDIFEGNPNNAGSVPLPDKERNAALFYRLNDTEPTFLEILSEDRTYGLGVIARMLKYATLRIDTLTRNETVDLPNKEGHTLLYIAAAECHDKLADALVRLKADAYLAIIEESPYEMAVRTNMIVGLPNSFGLANPNPKRSHLRRKELARIEEEKMTPAQKAARDERSRQYKIDWEERRIERMENVRRHNEEAARANSGRALTDEEFDKKYGTNSREIIEKMFS